MSIKCSLLGHRFDETSVERDREEDGSEVVITITELETCSRCGETRVVSENKEVTTMETPDEAARGAAEASPTGSESDRADASDEADDYDPDGDDAEILDADGAETDAQAQARGATIPDAEGGEAVDAADPGPGEDDAVIIDGDDAAGESASGDATAGTAGDATADVADDAREGAAADDDADRDAGEWPDEEESVGAAEPAVGDSDGEWPEEPADVDAGESYDDWPDETKRDTSGDAGAAGPTLEEPASPTITVPEGMFKCSECGFTTEVESSSLRAGDFCPECHTGTLVQHDDDA